MAVYFKIHNIFFRQIVLDNFAIFLPNYRFFLGIHFAIFYERGTKFLFCQIKRRGIFILSFRPLAFKI